MPTDADPPGNGICELCHAHGYDLPPEIAARLQTAHETRTQAAAARTEWLNTPDPYPRVRKAILLCGLAFTLGVLLSGVLRWTQPQLRSSMRYALIGFPTGMGIIALVGPKLYGLPFLRVITNSSHAVLLVIVGFIILDSSILLQMRAYR